MKHLKKGSAVCWVAAASLVALGRVNGELSERECVSSAGKLFNLFLVWLWLCCAAGGAGAAVCAGGAGKGERRTSVRECVSAAVLSCSIFL